MSRPGATTPEGLRLHCRSDGFLMLEVLAAVVLLGVLLVPLTSAVLAALGAADAGRGQDGALAGMAAESKGDEAWGWGAQITTAAWGPGPVLDIAVPRRGDASITVGLWVEGWFLGTYAPDQDGLVSVGTSDWRDAEGREVVMRVREGEGAWGPPRRSIVVSRGGDVPGPAMIDVAPTAGGACSPEPRLSVVHARAFVYPKVRVTAAVGSVEFGPLGLFLLVDPSGLERCGLGLGPETPEDQAQSWYAEERRAVDLYF